MLKYKEIRVFLLDKKKSIKMNFEKLKQNLLFRVLRISIIAGFVFFTLFYVCILADICSLFAGISLFFLWPVFIYVCFMLFVVLKTDDLILHVKYFGAFFVVLGILAGWWYNRTQEAIDKRQNYQLEIIDTNLSKHLEANSTIKEIYSSKISFLQESQPTKEQHKTSMAFVLVIIGLYATGMIIVQSRMLLDEKTGNQDDEKNIEDIAN